ncbi:MAG: glycosyltransferase family 39 protein [Proteobacteria bacterium]|nr:glycosyltransferase family 39 protein [Pseudomonadota bacterium]
MSAAPRAVPGLSLAVAVLAVLTLVRLAGLHFSVVDLYVDESQYWAWSREPAFGYFSKPPLLAWIIAAAERVCGASEACLRAPAPILYFTTSLLAYFVALRLYDARVAFWTALTVALSTGVVFSARIISTDVPLLFFWTLALLAYVNLRERPHLGWAVLLGVAIGLGINAKYAMVYFVLCIALAALVEPLARRLIYRPELYVALIVAAVTVFPNLAWNASNSFTTLRHTGDNISGGGAIFSLQRGFEFLASQLAVFGPIVFLVLIAVIARCTRAVTPASDRLMLAFSLPVLALITATAFTTRAHANWAAPAFIAAAILVTAEMVRAGAWRLMALSLAIGLGAQGVLLFADAHADRVRVPGFPKPDIYARTMGWRALGEQTRSLAEKTGAATIVSDNRYDSASLLYYLRDFARPVRVWTTGPTPQNHFEMTRPLTASDREPILFISPCASASRLDAAFRGVERVGAFVARTGPTSLRHYFAFRLTGGRGAPGAIPYCPG